MNKDHESNVEDICSCKYIFTLPPSEEKEEKEEVVLSGAVSWVVGK